jgi:DNA-binding MltR family transcriptional regulator
MWMIEDNETVDILTQISTQPARAGVIVIGAILDDRLQSILESRFVKDDGITAPLFKGYGPLSSFSARIELCYLMNVYSKEVRDNLNTIRKIRNVCAHEKNILNYDERPIVDHCRNFTLPEKYENHEGHFLDLFKEIDLNNPKHRFLRTCQIFNNLLIVAASNAHGISLNKNHPII